MLPQIQKFLSLIGFLLLIVVNFAVICSPAFAVLRQHHEVPGVLRYHAQHSLRDLKGRTWQVVLFPEIHANKPTKYYLRLVGFPGVAEFIHPQSLKIITSKNQILMATDVFAKSAPAPNVGQYDLTKILFQLSQEELELSVALKGNNNLFITIPKSVILEWQWLVNEI